LIEDANLTFIHPEISMYKDLFYPYPRNRGVITVEFRHLIFPDRPHMNTQKVIHEISERGLRPADFLVTLCFLSQNPERQFNGLIKFVSLNASAVCECGKKCLTFGGDGHKHGRCLSLRKAHTEEIWAPEFNRFWAYRVILPGSFSSR
jgi:hypothetical protein